MKPHVFTKIIFVCANKCWFWWFNFDIKVSKDNTIRQSFTRNWVISIHCWLWVLVSGAFYPGVPVQPVCLRYPNRLVSSCLVIILNTCAQLTYWQHVCWTIWNDVWSKNKWETSWHTSFWPIRKPCLLYIAGYTHMFNVLSRICQTIKRH